jgi:hypothetical protein
MSYFTKIGLAINSKSFKLMLCYSLEKYQTFLLCKKCTFCWEKSSLFIGKKVHFLLREKIDTQSYLLKNTIINFFGALIVVKKVHFLLLLKAEKMRNNQKCKKLLNKSALPPCTFYVLKCGKCRLLVTKECYIENNLIIS